MQDEDTACFTVTLLPESLLTMGFVSLGEIIGGHGAKPHSRPYMAFLQFKISGKSYICGGFLVREDFVLTAAHCLGSSVNVILGAHNVILGAHNVILGAHNIMDQERTQQVIQGCEEGNPTTVLQSLWAISSSINVTLGAHNIKQQERTQQVIWVRRAIRHPDYNPKNFSNDIILLQLERKAKQTSAVKPLSLPKAKARVKPGQVCSVAGWGQVALGTPATTLQEAELTVQEDRVCESLYPRHYSRATQKCVGDPRKVKTGFKAPSSSFYAPPPLLFRPLATPLSVAVPSTHPCDLKPQQPQPKGVIIGGTESKRHSRPYMAYLEIVTSQEKQVACGGFLIRRDFVLTAAHCAGSSINVTLGAHTITDQERTQQVIQVRRAIPHPDYNDETCANDIMLLQLNQCHLGAHNITEQRGSSSQINVILGAHNIRTLESTQQHIPVLRSIPHPGHTQQNKRNDIMLLQALDSDLPSTSQPSLNQKVLFYFLLVLLATGSFSLLLSDLSGSRGLV
ncbi:hypothetical protein JEQ12_007887 [Ovis aries]|uniref:Peptidase S1 domain-containing protein n=1 Tax=Ovis aries TaxID=9940 RepID=A0A835ZP61_SHEEP|nr:hypothetical protein JEQ12_007887 [Ovis aries]